MAGEPPRVVSLVPSWTETLHALGLGGGIVAATRYCVHPAEPLARVERVGGTKDPDVERIVQLRPDLVVCEKEENRRGDVETLRAAGLAVWLSEVRSVEDAARWTASLGAAVGRAEGGRALARRIEATAREVAARAVAPPVRLFVPVWRRPWMTLARGTYANDALALAGGANVYADAAGRYPERTPEEARAAGAEAALLPTEPYPFHEKTQAADEIAAAGFPRQRVALVDGEALTWYGVRAVEGLRVVAEAVRRVAVPEGLRA